MINRNNYESIFLLAVDNELSAQERNVLDEFLKNNSDLQEEFNLLQKSIVPIENIVYKNKISLLKPESISAEMEEKILLFIDDEINEKDIDSFKTAMAGDLKIETEFRILKQTKLLPDTSIIFVNKQLLYKKEERTVIPLGWMKFAAAAIFIGVGIWGAVKYLPVDKGLNIQIAVKSPLQNQGSVQIATINSPAAPLFQETEVTKNSSLTQGHIIAKNIVKPSLQTTKKQANLKADKIVIAEQKINKPDNNIPAPYYTKGKPSDNKLLNTIDKLIDNTAGSEIAFDNSPSKIINTPNQNQVYTTSFADNTDTNKEDQFTFSDDENEPKKSRLSGLLRKAKRVLERNTKIKASNENLKVANLEFATQ